MQMLKGKGEFFTTHISKEELPDWIAYQKTTNVFIDTFLETASSLNYYWFSFGPVALGISTYQSLTEEETTLFKRFLKVFELSYTRYLDIEQAIAQAREAEIELALERVRAKTMSMQKPSEFVNVINIIGEQFINLGFEFDWVNFSANGHDVSKAIDIWNFIVVPGVYQGATRLVIPFFEHPVFSKAEESVAEYFNKGNEFTVVLLNKKEKDRFLDHLFTNTIYKDLPNEVKVDHYNREVYMTSNVVLKDTWLSIGKYDAKPLPGEQIIILKRLGKAFGQAYTRFLDLQKAEAQAREAQIETALEKIRSRSLAMHHSEELGEVVSVLFDRMAQLGVVFDGININIIKPDEKGFDSWLAAPGQAHAMCLHVPFFDDPVTSDLFNALESGTVFFSKIYSREEKDAYFHKVFKLTDFRQLPDERKKMILNAEQWCLSIAIAKNTAISLHSYTGHFFSENDSEILKRFSKVFEQSYVRFLDLQKAEAQAREAQIELGLERVRARAMAMQTSEELNALIGIVFTELTKLDLVLTRCVIIIYDAETKGAQWWMANSEAPSAPMNFFVKYANLSFFNVYLKGWKERDLKWQYILEGENKIVTDNFLFNETELKTLPDFVIEGMKAPHKVYLNASFNNFGNLTLATLEPLSEKHFEILLRFAKVFDLTYTRFNDLQKAEAQARESQIQLALERVRAKTMAMHSSDDVTSATETMFDELKKLGINNIRGGIANIHPEKTMDVFGITNMIDGKTMKGFTLFDVNEHPIWQRLFESWNNKDEVFIDYLAGQEKEDYINVINSHQNYLPQSIVEFPDTYFQSYRFDQGNIWTYSLQPHSESDREIMKRFASGFALTFRRYQDLKQAEAQAHEALIEAALERVRARTMAMFKSDELAETAVVVFQQLISLGIEPHRLYIGIINDESGDLEIWMTDEEGKQVSKRYVVNIHKNISIKKMYEGWKEQRQTLSVDMSENELHEWITYWNKEFGVPFMQGAGQQRRVQNLAYFSKGFIATTTFENAPKETVSLLNRFAAVFNLTYTRFNDLQLAEAQAREATIEAALEKVRGKAMAMHNSNDLSVTASLVFTELRKLGINPIRCGVGLFNKESRKSQLYSATIISRWR